MKLFVGLGNPGDKYARHRHNVGFMAIDRIAERYDADGWRRRFHGQTADVRIGGERVLLLKPATYMNESGQSAGEAQRFLKIPLEDVFVFHDEIDLEAARAWYEEAAAQGHPRAAFRLALMQVEGRGGPVDLAGAEESLTPAAE